VVVVLVVIVDLLSTGGAAAAVQGAAAQRRQRKAVAAAAQRRSAVVTSQGSRSAAWQRNAAAAQWRNAVVTFQGSGALLQRSSAAQGVRSCSAAEERSGVFPCHCSSHSEITPFLRRRWRATCQCCTTTDAKSMILSKDRVKGLVSGTNIIFQGGFEFEFVHVFSEGAHCADGTRDVGGRGIHRCCWIKK